MSSVEQEFCDLHPPMTAQEAHRASARCYFCHDAPCIKACPTEIDIPSFIRKVRTGNRQGAATDILKQNIFGATCARVCPTEILCERACVRNHDSPEPVEIGALQRFATEEVIRAKVPVLSYREQASGKRVAVVGAGPAGLACAHRLARAGHQVEVFEKKSKSGGLNEYGLAAYKVTNDIVQTEIDYILKTAPRIEIHFEKELGRNIELARLHQDFDAVFLSTGHAGVRQLGLEGEDLEGCFDAIEYIAKIRQTSDLSQLKVGRRVVVIGGGNTAIDIAVQVKKLGAEVVTLVYRRGREQMGATPYEQTVAKENGVTIREWLQPSSLESRDAKIGSIEFEKTKLGSDGRLQGTGDYERFECDMIFKAIGQYFVAEPLGQELSLKIESGRIWVDEQFQTSVAGIFAGGDCIPGDDLTVVAVADGQKAAGAIDQFLSGGKSSG